MQTFNKFIQKVKGINTKNSNQELCFKLFKVPTLTHKNSTNKTSFNSQCST